MAFPQESTAIPESIRNFSVTLRSVKNADDSISKYAEFHIEVIMSDDTVRDRIGDLIPHITVAQRNGLTSFMDTLRTQAEDQILP